MSADCSISYLYQSIAKGIAACRCKKVGVLLGCCLLAGVLWAQQFTLSGAVPADMRGRVSLLIYDADANPRQQQCNIVDGTFFFKGTVKAPSYAEVHLPSLSQSVPLFLDASEITIDVAPQNPEASRINGSRATSLFRYAEETCRGGDHVACVVSHITDHPSDFFAPYMLYSCASSLEYTQLKKLVDGFTGDALTSYHYRLLRHRVQQLASTIEGQPLPDFVFPNNKGSQIHFDSVRSDSTYTILIFGATWCGSCLAADHKITDMLKRHNSGRKHKATLLTVNIDKDKRQWDNPMLQQLAIDYIPYIIVVDPQGRTFARDVRVWEMERVLNTLK